MRILVTGFGPFGKVDDNPTMRIIEALDAQQIADLLTAILPVTYRADEQIAALVREHQPDALLMTGVAQGRPHICLERFALNLDDASIPDIDDNLRQGEPIIADGPHAYLSTLPLNQMLKHLQAAAVPARISNHAGTYICNHVFYGLRHRIETGGLPAIPAGFVHVPAIGDEAPCLPLDTMIRAVSVCITALHELTTA